jgi:hypothetical protein
MVRPVEPVRQFGKRSGRLAAERKRPEAEKAAKDSK